MYTFFYSLLLLVVLGDTASGRGWRSIPEFGTPPTQRRDHAMTLSPDRTKIYMFGGVDSSQVGNDLWVFELPTTHWDRAVTIGPTPHAVISHTLSHLSEKILLLGGFGDQGAVTDHYFYDPRWFLWSKVNIPKAPPPFNRHCAVVMNNNGVQRVYKLFGLNNLGVPTAEDHVFTFDEDTSSGAAETMVYIGDAPRPERRRDPACINIDDNAILVFAGRTEDQVVKNDAWLLTFPDSNDHTKGIWLLLSPNSAGANRPEARVFPFLGYYNDIVSTGLGFKISGQQGNDVWSFGPMAAFLNIPVTETYADYEADLVQAQLSSRWTRKWQDDGEQWRPNSGRPAPRDEIDSVTDVTTGATYVFGGLLFCTSCSGPFSNELWSYSAPSNTWKSISTEFVAPVGRVNHNALIVNNFMVTLFGEGPQNMLFNDVWLFDLVETHLWYTVDVGHPPAGRHSASVVASGDLLIVFGGMTAEGSTDQVWNLGLTLTNNTAGPSLVGYSLFGRWSSVTPLDHDAAWPSARFGHGAVLLFGDQMYIYGGMKAGKQLSDLWKFSIATHEWSEVSAVGAPPSAVSYMGMAPLHPTSAVGSEGFLVLGGAIGGETPTAYRYTFNATTKAWRDVSGDAALNIEVWSEHHAPIAGSGDKFWRYGGRLFGFVVDRFYVFDVKTGTHQSINTAPVPGHSIPSLRYGHTAIWIANKYVMFGGIAGAFHRATPLLGHFLNDIWEFQVENVCESDDSAGTCFSCSHGSVALKNDHTGLVDCVACGQGEWSNNGGSCLPCGPGKYGPLVLAASAAGCKPCPNGTYSEANITASCLPCAPGQYCPIGSITPGTTLSNEFQAAKAQPQPIGGSDSLPFWVYIALLAGGLILLVIAVVSLRLFKGLLKSLDFYSKQHWTPLGSPVIVQKTRWGGIVSVAMFVALIILIVISLLQFFYDNEIVVTALEPRMLQQGNFTGNINVMFEINGYENCIGNGNGLCHSSIYLVIDDQIIPSGDDSLHPDVFPVCTAVNSTCVVTMQCNECRMGQALTDMTLHLTDGFAHSIVVNVNTNTGVQQDNGEEGVSAYSIPLTPPNGTVLRGPMPSVVSMSLFTTLFDDRRTISETSGQNFTGYHLDVRTATMGTVLDQKAFSIFSGLKVAVEFQVIDSTLRLTVNDKSTPTDLLAKVGGLATSVMGLFVAIMATIESIAHKKGGFAQRLLRRTGMGKELGLHRPSSSSSSRPGTASMGKHTPTKLIRPSSAHDKQATPISLQDSPKIPIPIIPMELNNNANPLNGYYNSPPYTNSAL